MVQTSRQRLIANVKLEVESGMNRSRNPRKLTDQEKEQKRIKLEELEAQEESDKALIAEIKKLEDRQCSEAISTRDTVCSDGKKTRRLVEDSEQRILAAITGVSSSSSQPVVPSATGTAPDAGGGLVGFLTPTELGQPVEEAFLTPTQLGQPVEEADVLEDAKKEYEAALASHKKDEADRIGEIGADETEKVQKSKKDAMDMHLERRRAFVKTRKEQLLKAKEGKEKKDEEARLAFEEKTKGIKRMRDQEEQSQEEQKKEEEEDDKEEEEEEEEESENEQEESESGSDDSFNY